MALDRIARHALLIALALGGSLGRAAAVDPDSCAGLPVLPAGEALRGAGFTPGETHRLAVEVAEPGVLVLSVAAPGREAPAAEIVADPAPCGPGATGAPPAPTTRAAGSLRVEIAEPGLYPLRIEPRDPLLALGPYRVESRFAPLAPVASPAGGPRSLGAADGTGGAGGGPQGEEEEEIDEVDGDPINRSGPGRFAPFCRRTAAADDHADLALCATRLEPGAAAAGALGNRFGDDYDFFVFTLAAPARVTAETSGATDTLGGLYDARGRRLAVADDGGPGGNFRLEAALGPGRYHVRVEGADGAEGEYGLRLAVAGE